MRHKCILFLLIIFNSIPAIAGIKCNDVKYGNEKYHENMEELAKQAHLQDSYYNRYHEDAVKYLCANEGEGVRRLVDEGAVKSSEIEAIKKVLGKDDRAEHGQSYRYSKQKFMDIGLCMACADNVAQYYTKKPDSQCGKLAKQALEGNPSAIEELKKSLSYCVWTYEHISDSEKAQEKNKVTTTKQEERVYELMRRAAAYPVTDVSACIGGVKIAASTYADLLRQGALQSEEYTKFSIQNQFQFAFENGSPVDKNAFWIMFEILRINNASWAEVSENGGNNYAQQVALWEAITCKFNSNYAGIHKSGPLQKDAVVKLVDLLIAEPKKANE